MNHGEMHFKIIYIVGTGRNGSTLLDIVLGNSKVIKSTGEVYNALRAWDKKKNCSCKNNVENCIFWSKVKKLFEESFKDLDFKQILKLEHRYERDICAPIRLIFNKISPSREYKQYQKFLKILYSSILRASSKPVIVDSSKNPFRGYVLSEIFKNQVFFIHLVRDGRGSMWSWLKTGTIPPFGISIKKAKTKNFVRPETNYYWWTPWLYAISWLIYNIISSVVVWSIGPNNSIRIQYEEFLYHPLQHTKTINELIKADLTDLEKVFQTNDSFAIDHLIAGNRVRMQDKLVLRLPDEEWRQSLFKQYQKIFWLVCGWMASRYGYKSN